MAMDLWVTLIALSVFTYVAYLVSSRSSGGETKKLSRANDNGEHENCRVPKLTQLWPGDRDIREATIDIIAIHGLDAQSPDTWQTYGDPTDDAVKRVHWLRDENMLHHEFPHAAIYTYDWLSDTYRNAAQDSLRGHAETLLDEVRDRSNPGRHLVFVASCFGGLLLIKAVLMASRRQYERHGMLEDIRGIVFLGTPFRKSDAGSAAQTRARVAKAMGGTSCEELVRYLLKDDPALPEVIEDFDSIIRQNPSRMKLICYYETRPTQIYNAILPTWLTKFMPWGKFILVPRESASIAGVEARPMNVTHGFLNKFINRKSEGFREVTRSIKQIAEHAKQSDVCYLLQEYYKHNDNDRLNIVRLSGSQLPMENCYINLCTIEHRDQAKRHNPGNTTPPSRLSIDASSESEPVDMKSIFDVRTQSGTADRQLRRVIIWGRAGIGKSTLCKKLVHDFLYNNQWAHLFDCILWIPLRELKYRDIRSDSLEDMILNKFFVNQDHKLLQSQLDTIGQTRSLYILDGLDEVTYALDSDTYHARIIQCLLRMNNVIVTSRPHSTHFVRKELFNLELETTGFLPDQIEDYLEAAKELTTESRIEIKLFLKQHSHIQSLARIPIQLDAICSCWDGIRTQSSAMTMTSLYKSIELKSWEKYLASRRKMTQAQLQDAVDHSFIQSEDAFLGKLAFDGLYNEVVEFDKNLIDHIKANHIRTDHIQILNDTLTEIPFLRSSDSFCTPSERTFHFLHLTFQEYFAARYFVKCWISQVDISVRKPMGHQWSDRNDVVFDPRSFLGAEKYSPRYDIFWRFAAGFLQGEESDGALTSFFDAIENEPQDLLGPHHQRLVIRCLNEVRYDDDYWVQLRDRYHRWIHFVLVSDELKHLSQPMVNECPDGIILSMLEDPSRRLAVLQNLAVESSLSPRIIHRLVDLLGNCDDPELRHKLVRKLAEYSATSSDRQVIEVICQTILVSDEPHIQALHVLEYRTITAMPIFDTLIHLVKCEREDFQVRRQAAKVVKRQKRLPSIVIDCLTQHALDDTQNYIGRKLAIKGLGRRLQLSQTVIEEFLCDIKDESKDLESRQLKLECLRFQASLSPAVLHDIFDLAQNSGQSRAVRRSALSALTGRKQLPELVTSGLVKMLRDEEDDDEIGCNVANILEGQELSARTTAQDLLQIIEHKTPGTVLHKRILNVLWNVDPPLQSVIDERIRVIGDCMELEWRRRYALYALQRQRSLSTLEITSIVKLLKDKDNSTEDLRWCAILCLGAHIRAHPKVMRVLENVVMDQSEQFKTRCDTATVLYHDGELSNLALDSLLPTFDQFARGMNGGLPFQERYEVEIMLFLMLDRERLPTDFIRLVLSFPEWEASDWRIRSLLRDRQEVVELIPDIDPSMTRQLLRVWLMESVMDFFVCTIEEGSLCVRTDGGRVTRVAMSEDQLKAFLTVRKEVGQELEVPPYDMDEDERG